MQCKLLEVDRDSDLTEWRRVFCHHIGNIDLIRELEPESDMVDYHRFNTELMYSSPVSVPLAILFQWFKLQKYSKSSAGFPR